MLVRQPEMRMRRQLLLTIVAALLAAGTAFADMGPPPGYSLVRMRPVIPVVSDRSSAGSADSDLNGGGVEG
jgi:hypothetical protein